MFVFFSFTKVNVLKRTTIHYCSDTETKTSLTLLFLKEYQEKGKPYSKLNQKDFYAWMIVIFIVQNEVNDNRSIYPLVFKKHDHQKRTEISNWVMEEGNNRKVYQAGLIGFLQRFNGHGEGITKEFLNNYTQDQTMIGNLSIPLTSKYIS